MMNMEKLSDKELEELVKNLHLETSRRKNNEFKRKKLCPDCDGIGFLGGDLDHYPCRRCEMTGVYKEKL